MLSFKPLNMKKIKSLKNLEDLPEGEWVEAEFEKGSIVFKKEKEKIKTRQR
jgi:hypothetical protein